MTRIVFVTFVTLMLFACPPGPSGDGGTGGGRGGGSGGGTGSSPFVVSELDGTAREATHFAIAVDPVAERVGVAYFTPAGTSTIGGDAGVTPDYNLNYVEWSRSLDGGSTVTTPETIVVVQRTVGVTLAFDPANGEPVVGYLGGPTDLNTSIFWFQNDAAVNRRHNGTWTESLIATMGNDNTGACAMTTSGVGSIIGLWPASAFGADGKYYQSYRDVHSGQFPQQDWAASDMELWEGNVPPTTPVCVKAGGDDKQAWGGHQQMAIGADDQPALVSDQIQGSAAGDGANVVFSRRQTSGAWTPAAVIFNVGNTQTGPWVAWDQTEGFGIAVVDKSVDELNYLRLPPGGSQWYTPDPVYGQGSGGWYPTLAMDPINHEPAIAFYICSSRSGVNESSCTQLEDKLVVSQRIVGNWRETLVDNEGGYHPHLAFFASGKKVVVYRQPSSLDSTGHKVTNVGALKIAVEK